MYTVVRFTSCSLPRAVFERLGGALDELVPGAFKGLRHAGDGFACEIASADDWEDHQAEILQFIRRSVPVISEAQERGVSVCVDVAIEPEDIQATAVFTIHIDPILAQRLAEAGVILALSFYSTASKP